MKKITQKIKNIRIEHRIKQEVAAGAARIGLDKIADDNCKAYIRAGREDAWWTCVELGYYVK